ncbi:MAG TPA: histidinol-phosphate transaminase [Candidatus Nitrosotalea sp.]|nr:histidinol-phosphate transaminase [Candidatus Nitrosotalea sp.]
MPPRFLKPGLAGFEAYVPGQQPPDGEDWVKLNTNECPWPPSPRALAAVRDAVGPQLRLYPDPMATPARAAIARLHGLDPACVALGNGGDELLEMAFRAFVGPGSRVAFVDPTYPLVPTLVALHEGVRSAHRLGPAGSLDPGFAQDPAGLKILVNPNSPTGTWLGREVVQEVQERARGLLLLDEAYVDFAPEDRTDLLRAGATNLLILRTLSKSYALAGMRLGYALGAPEVIAALDLVKDSYNMDRLAIVAAKAAIEDQEHHRDLVERVIAGREELSGELVRRGFECLPSATNFVFCRPPEGRSALSLYEHLKSRRVLVRHYAVEPIAGWLRITVGTDQDHRRLFGAIEEMPL